MIADTYRYLLWRIWDERLPRLLWVLLNPSTADAGTDDPTLRKCRTFSAAWGFGGLEIVNLFALRTPYPRDLFGASDPVGPENDPFIAAAANRASDIIVAWGNLGTLHRRDRTVLDLLSSGRTSTLLCLGVTKPSNPRHPLYIARSTLASGYQPGGSPPSHEPAPEHEDDRQHPLQRR